MATEKAVQPSHFAGVAHAVERRQRAEPGPGRAVRSRAGCPSAANTASRTTSRRRCSSPNAAAAATRTNGGRKSEARYVPPKKAGVNPAAESSVGPARARRGRAPARAAARAGPSARDSSAIGTSTQAASARPRTTAAPQRRSVDPARRRSDGLRKGRARAHGQREREKDRRGRHLGASRHRLKADERAEAEDRGARPQTGARERRDPRQVCERAEVIPEHRERGGETRGGERRGAEERARVRDVLLLEKPARAPDAAIAKCEQEKEPPASAGDGQQEEPGRRIEHARLAVREPRLARCRTGDSRGGSRPRAGGRPCRASADRRNRPGRAASGPGRARAPEAAREPPEGAPRPRRPPRPAGGAAAPGYCSGGLEKRRPRRSGAAAKRA